ncbi:MAG: hypothetical protein JST80_03625 [Bdellovibrionales bacterium]|nr:hypothetical protein [Bdellovibrionales bacterium]
MLSNSDLHYITCLACAEVCEQVADEAEMTGAGMEDCIESCRHSAESCRQISIHEVKYMPLRGKNSHPNLYPE